MSENQHSEVLSAPSDNAWGVVAGIYTVAAILLFIGALLLIFSAKVEISVDTPSSDGGIYGYRASTSVINIGLLQNQLMYFQAGLASCSVGLIGLLLGMAVGAVQRIASGIAR